MKFGHSVRKCSSVSGLFSLHWWPFLFSRGSQDLLCLLVSRVRVVLRLGQVKSHCITPWLCLGFPIGDVFFEQLCCNLVDSVLLFLILLCVSGMTSTSWPAEWGDCCFCSPVGIAGFYNDVSEDHCFLGDSGIELLFYEFVWLVDNGLILTKCCMQSLNWMFVPFLSHLVSFHLSHQLCMSIFLSLSRSLLFLSFYFCFSCSLTLSFSLSSSLSCLSHCLSISLPHYFSHYFSHFLLPPSLFYSLFLAVSPLLLSFHLSAASSIAHSRLHSFFTCFRSRSILFLPLFSSLSPAPSLFLSHSHLLSQFLSLPHSFFTSVLSPSLLSLALFPSLSRSFSHFLFFFGSPTVSHSFGFPSHQGPPEGIQTNWRSAARQDYDL